MLSIKDEEELRHVLAHVLNAIGALADGRPATARRELTAIEGLVFQVNMTDRQIEADYQRRDDGLHKENAEAKAPAQTEG